MWGYIKKALNSEFLTKPLNTIIRELTGANTDTAGTTTLFARLKQIYDYLSTNWTTARAAKVDNLDTTVSSRATQSGVDTVNTNVVTVNTKVGVNTDAAGTGTVFARLKQIYDNVSGLSGYVDTLETLTGTANPASAGTDTLFKYSKRLDDLIINTGYIYEVSNTIRQSADALVTTYDSSSIYLFNPVDTSKYKRFISPQSGRMRLTFDVRTSSSSYRGNCSVIVDSSTYYSAAIASTSFQTITVDVEVNKNSKVRIGITSGLNQTDYTCSYDRYQYYASYLQNLKIRYDYVNYPIVTADSV